MATIIFDFDGTIANSFVYVTDFLASGKGLSLSDGQRAELHGMSMAAIARSLGYRWWRLPRLFLQGRNVMTKALHHVQPFAGMPELIMKLHAEGHELFVLSSNTVRNVHAFLHHYDLHKYFLEIYGGVGLFGKAPALRRLLKEQSIDKADALYIGDELRDVEAAQSIHLRVIAVTWGFARPSDLVDHRPTHVVDTPDDLLHVLEEV
ncbi:MAG TPA: HAD hydrolase-like protein [Candidatus Saccharimonadales bacterium]|nr:HAD hydrolase-like protein [Candidatus Saccharimonadales bacterium]